MGCAPPAYFAQTRMHYRPVNPSVTYAHHLCPCLWTSAV